MYDDTTDHATGSGSHEDEMTVTVQGEDYEVQENYDVDHDGHNDTAVIQTDDGGAVAFTDSDHDGHADVAVEVDDHGNVVGAARYDEGTGEWVAVDPKTGQETGDHGDPTGGHTSQTGDHHSTGSTSGSGSGSHPDGDIMVDAPSQKEDVDAGKATVDMNHDGKNDTAVQTRDDGTVVGYTDTDGDGEADVITIIEADGDVTIGEHTGEDQWTDVEHGHIDSQGNYTPDNTGSRR